MAHNDKHDGLSPVAGSLGSRGDPSEGAAHPSAGDSNLAPGVQITSNLRLVRELGAGGMGSVWVADHLTLETQVAVKFIHADLARKGSDLAKRFSREAKVAAKLKSPHVVQTFDHGWMEDGTPYIVMELLEGENLANRIARGPLSLQDTKLLVSQVAEVLQRAHASGIVHRDLKPQNIFLIESGYDIFAKVQIPDPILVDCAGNVAGSPN